MSHNIQIGPPVNINGLDVDASPDDANDYGIIYDASAGKNKKVLLSNWPGGGGDAFTTMQTDAGTSPVADSATDTLTLTSSDSSLTITGNSTTDTVDYTVRYSNAGTGTNSTMFGTSTVASAHNAIALGYGANATGTSSIAIGSGTYAIGYSTISIGANCNTNNKSNAVCIGISARAESANSLVLGSPGNQIKNIFMGEGEYTNLGTHDDVSIRPTRPNNVTNTVGGDMLIMGSGSTGNVVGSSVKIQTQTATSASGTTANTTWSDMAEFNGSKEIIFHAEDGATADGSLWNNSISFYLDESGNTLTVKAKYSTGTVKTGTVALT